MNENLPPHLEAAYQVAKMLRVRSVAYPSNTINHCVTLVERINRIFGNLSYNNREQLSKNLSISDSHIQTQLSSCVQYGLLELKIKEGYKSTSLFTKIYKPLPDEDKKDALKECFFKPELYKKIIDDCKGKTLTQEGLSTILYRNYKVSESAAPVAAKIFLENANDLGLIGDDNILVLEGDITAIEQFEADEKPPVEERQKGQVTYLPPSGNGTKKEEESEIPPIPIFLDGDNRIAKLYMPKGFSKEDLMRVAKVLNAYVA